MKHGKQSLFALLLSALLLLAACSGTGAGETGTPGPDGASPTPSAAPDVPPGKMPPDKDALSAAASGSPDGEEPESAAPGSPDGEEPAPAAPGSPGEEEPASAAPGGGTQADGDTLVVQAGGSRYQISFRLEIPGEMDVSGHEYWDGAPKGKMNWTDELPEGAQALSDGTYVRSGLGFYDGSLDAQIVPAGVTYREWYYPVADIELYLCFRWDETDLEAAEAVRATLRYSVESFVIPHTVAGYEGILSPEDWEVLSGFLPVLNGEKTFRWFSLDSDGVSIREMQEVTWEEFPAVYWGETYSEWDTALGLVSFALCDIDGGGGKELILCITPGASAYYLILHREGTEFYGVDFWYRAFEDLQQNGVFIGTGGAGANSYYRLRFQNGGFERELLGSTDWGEYHIGGETVDAETFARWVSELWVGGAEWFPLA